MARVKVEDCLKKVSSRFDLIIMASKRAHFLMANSDSESDGNHDKPTVVALKEIADGKVSNSECQIEDLNNI